MRSSEPNAATRSSPSRCRNNGSLFLLPEQSNKILYREAGVSDYVPKRARSNPLVIGNNYASMRFVAPENHMASLLPLKNEAGVFQRRSHGPARQIHRQSRRHPYERILKAWSGRSVDFDKFSACLTRNLITGSPAIFYVKRDGFPNIPERFRAIFPLADTAG